MVRPIDPSKPPEYWPEPEEHRSQLARGVASTLPKAGGDPMTGPLLLATYTENPDTRPPASEHTGGLIWVSDQEEVQVSDGTDWIGRALELIGYGSVTFSLSDTTAGFSWDKIEFDTVVFDPDSMWVGSPSFHFDITQFTNRVAVKVTTWGYFENSSNTESDGAIGVGVDGATPTSFENFPIASGGSVSPNNRLGWGIHTIASPFMPAANINTVAGYFQTGTSVDLAGDAFPAWLAVEVYQ